MTRLLEDKIAIVTGGGQGPGQAVSCRMAHEGCHVLVADLNEQAAAETAEAIVKTETSQRALSMKVDVTNEDQVKEMVDLAVRKFGRLDLLVANAGIVISDAITDFDAGKGNAVINVNLNGYFLVAKHAAPVMKEQKSGNI